MKPIPVLVVAGFLGAGKTTLLNSMLRSRRGVRVGAVVNDFGSVNIDALLVAGQVDAMVALSNGCVCCVVEDGDLEEALVRLADAQAELDVIVVEASGLAEPRAVAQRVLGCQSPRVRFGGLVVVVDATTVVSGSGADQARELGLDLRRQLRAAELVLVNKADLVGEGELAQVESAVRAVNEWAPIVATTFGRLDTALLFDAVDRPDDLPRQLSIEELLYEDDGHGEHAHEGFASVEFSSAEAFDPRKLMALLARTPRGLYRIKGVVGFGVVGHGQRFVVNTVGSFVRFERTRWGAGEPRCTQLVLIGAGFDAAEVTAAFAQCLAGAGPGAGMVDEGAMAGVLRYTVGVGV